MDRKKFLLSFISGISLFRIDKLFGREKKVNSDYLNKSIIDVKDFGAVGDGNRDDYLSIQKAIDYCILNKKTLYLSRPSKSYISTKKLIISDQIYIFGDGMSLCGINFLNSDGFEIQDGVKNVFFERMSINQAIRHTNKENVFCGIKILGSNKKRPYTHNYKDVFIDGFHTAISSEWLWDSLFDNIKILFCNIGIEIKGTAVNNVISNCSISVEGKKSKGLFFNDTKHPTEGWRISNILIFGAAIGIHAFYTNNIFVTTPILDFCSDYGILLEPGSGSSTNWQIIGGYIAMSGTEGNAAIKIVNTTDNWQFRGSKISNVDILAYKGSKCRYGIDISNSKDKNNILSNNSFSNISVGNIR